MAVFTGDYNVSALANELEKEGFVCLEKAIDSGWIRRAQDHIRELLDQKGNRYFALNWPSRGAGTPWQEVAHDRHLVEMLESLVSIGCPRAGTNAEVYDVLRVITGSSGDRKSLLYHYDNYVLTALVPILIPQGPPRKTGELFVSAKRRAYRSIALTNAIEKAVVQSNWYRKRITAKLPRTHSSEIKVLEPGNLYLFWGYRTYHANFPVSHDLVRATLLLHCGDPHPGSLLLRGLKTLNLRRERRNLEKPL